MPPSRLLKSLSFRLTVGYVLLFALFTAALLGLTYWSVGVSLTRYMRSTIDSDIAAVQSGFQAEGTGEAQEVVRQLLAASNSPRARQIDRYISLQDASNQPLAGNVRLAQPLPGWHEGRLTDIGTPLAPAALRVNIDSIVVLAEGVSLPDGSRLWVARDMEPVAGTRARLAVAFLWMAIAAMALAAATGIWFGTRLMRRTESMAETCDAIVAGHFEGRVALTGEDELTRLGRAINAMLDRVETLLDNLRQVSSDIAHDLRTPMTRLRQRLENMSLMSASLDEYPAAAGRAMQELDSILLIFAALLRISEVEAGARSAQFTPVSLNEQLLRLQAIFSAVAEDLGHQVDCVLEPAISVPGDAELLFQMFTNVLENALHHTPRGSRVQITLRAQGTSAVVAIADNGPGVPEEERGKVLRRFYRLERSRTGPGHGLGLALVSAIAGLHGAALVLADNQPGLRVEIVFPRMLTPAAP